MRRKDIVAAAAALLTSVPVLAQPVPSPSVPVPPVLPGAPALPRGTAGVPPNPQAMLAAFEAAQATAGRPGDENLSCEKLETEIAATMGDPAIAAYVEAAGVGAQQDLAALQAAQGPLAAAQTRAAIAGALLPGGNGAATIVGAAQAQAAQARAAQRMQSQMLQTQQLTALMPQFMRGQHLVQLATTKQCAWLAGAGVPGPAGLPTPKAREGN